MESASRHRARPRPAESDASTDTDDPQMAEARGLAEALAASWRSGVCCRAEALLDEHPDLCKHPRAAIRVIYEEFRQRQERGQDVTLSELQQRFPAWREELAVVLDCHWLLELAAAGPCFPAVGETLGDFRLLAELGRGGMGRVYLAEQSFLAGRRLIVKLTASGNQEHLNLARLQHTYIVPLYSVREFPERNLRKLVMPCLGGATLQPILSALQSIPVSQRTGRHPLDALRSSVADPRLFWPSEGPNRRFLERASYIQAVCWIGVCLAEALQYAHEQGLVHLDVKPSNVLLTADCQPMLLDFHLARAPIVAAKDDPAFVGGTPAYMSPEQRAAWQTIRTRQPIPAAVDVRSDIYALGLLLRELLFGDSSAEIVPRGDVSKGLCDLLTHCLETDPDARYRAAGDVAEDLRRHLTHRPLVGVRNRSLAERWRKWRRRRPYALLLAALLVGCLGSALALVSVLRVQRSEQRLEAETALAQANQQVVQHRFADAVQTLDHALAHVATGENRGALRTARRHAGRGHDAITLRRWMERSRYLHGEDSVAPATLRSLESECRAVWDSRDRLLPGDDEPFDADFEESLHRDLLDVAILWADCRRRLASSSAMDAARREALQTLREADALLGPSPILSRQRHFLEGTPAVDPPAPRTAWEHYTLGRALMRDGEDRAAADAFERAVALRPQDFWPWFGKGVCAHRRQRAGEAITAFSVCIALSPQSAECYHNRAAVLAMHGDSAAALRDYDKALQLDPHLAAAALSRGVLRLRERHFDEAEADLRRALELGADPAAVEHNRALLRQARK